MISRTRELIRRKGFLALLFLALHIAGFISSIDAVMRARTSQGAIAWVISLNTVPIVSLPAYWVLGRTKFQGYVLARQQDDSQLSQNVTEKMNDNKEFVSDLSSNYPAVRAAELLDDLPLTKGNSAELLIDGEASFASIFEGIEQAREYVLVQFYIVKDDDLGKDLKDRLILKALYIFSLGVNFTSAASVYYLPLPYTILAFAKTGRYLFFFFFFLTTF